MTRDWELIRDILQYAEELRAPTARSVEETLKYFQCEDAQLFKHNFRLLVKNQFLKGSECLLPNGYVFLRLTFDGHDLLDNLRKPGFLKLAQTAAGVAVSTVISALSCDTLEAAKSLLGVK